jgi:hypothetical protein
MLEELNFKRQGSMVSFCDNNLTIKLFKIKFYMVETNILMCKDFINDGTIEIIYCKSEDQVYIIFIKSFKLEWFVQLRRLLGVCTQENIV